MNMQTSTIESTLTEVLAEEITQSGWLLEALEQERSVLQASEIDSLNEVVQKKVAITDALFALERKRMAILSEAGFNPAKSKQWLDKISSQPLGSLWNELIDITKKCHYQNRLNGAIVQSAQRRTQGLLALLRGEAKGTNTYAADGKQSNFSAGQRWLGVV